LDGYVLICPGASDDTGSHLRAAVYTTPYDRIPSSNGRFVKLRRNQLCSVEIDQSGVGLDKGLRIYTSHAMKFNFAWGRRKFIGRQAAVCEAVPRGTRNQPFLKKAVKFTRVQQTDIYGEWTT
jgi:hypothetical protein